MALITEKRRALTNEQKAKKMWQAKFAEFDRTRKTYDTMSALHTLAEYWVENEIIIERAADAEAETNGPKWMPDWNDRDSVGEWHSERDLARYMHDKTMIPMHRYSCIVMLYSIVERELLRLVENLENERGPQKLKWKDIRANSKVEQISKFCEIFFGFRLVDCSQYNAVTELQKIRDCIIHCLGNVGLSSDKDFLVKLKDKRRGFFAHPVSVAPVLSVAPIVKATSPATPPPISKKIVTRDNLATIFGNGARPLSRTAAVAELKRLGFGKTAAYSALSPDGRFNAWLHCASDGKITWKN